MSINNALIDTLLDPKCGDYYDKNAHCWRCIAQVKGKHVEIGWYDGETKDERSHASRHLWSLFWNTESDNKKNSPPQNERLPNLPAE